MTRSLTLAFLGVSLIVPTLHARTWTDSRGREVQAEYTSCHNGIVRMKTAAGNTHSILK